MFSTLIIKSTVKSKRTYTHAHKNAQLFHALQILYAAIWFAA